MIQVCSRCATRWNVRDRQRVWCPRCQGQLLAPVATAAEHPASSTPGSAAIQRPAAARLPAGFRWIAVRPGPPPPPRRRRRPLGPTPRYHAVPRWGLIDKIAPPTTEGLDAGRRPASPEAVRTTLVISAVVFAVAAATHVLRYLLLLINRTTLLPPIVAVASLAIGLLVSVAAIVAVMVTAVVTTSWLIGRRAAAFAQHGQDDPRPAWSLWAGCLVPVLNLFWAPVFVLELAAAERCRDRQNGPVIAWWIAWWVATLLCGWATWTSLKAHEPQAVADNTVATIIAYLAGLAVLALLWQVLAGFVRKPVGRPAHRWVVVADYPEEASGSDNDAQPDDDAEAAAIAAAEADTEVVDVEAVESREPEPAA